MNDSDQPYKRSIWDVDERYSIEIDNLSKDMLEKVGVVQSVESAKKRTPPIPIADIVKIINAVEKLPAPSELTVEKFQTCLEAIDSWGADIKTSICILSVLKKGLYPPLDWRIAKAAKIKNIVTDDEEKTLNGKNKNRIASIYVQKLLKGWAKELEQVKDPRTLDNQWGKLANGS
jgi:hypothetical protein